VQACPLILLSRGRRCDMNDITDIAEIADIADFADITRTFCS
jgi:hypothetical protein